MSKPASLGLAAAALFVASSSLAQLPATPPSSTVPPDTTPTPPQPVGLPTAAPTSQPGSTSAGLPTTAPQPFAPQPAPLPVATQPGAPAPFAPMHGTPYPSYAIPAQQSAASRLPALQRVMASVDTSAEDYHLAALIAGLGIGAVTIPAGIVMIEDRDPFDSGVGGSIMLGVGIGAVLGGTLQLLTPFGATQDLRGKLDDFVAGGVPPEAAVTTIEGWWREAADEAELERRVGGGIAMGLGTAFLGLGAVFAFAEVGDISTDDRHAVAAASGVAGALGVIAGLQAFLFETPLESAWNTYEATHDLGRPVGVAPPPPKLDVVAGPGVGLVTLSGGF
jgi:hypothetical protein